MGGLAIAIGITVGVGIALGATVSRGSSETRCSMTEADRARLDRLLHANAADFPDIPRSEIRPLYEDAADRLQARGCLDEAELLRDKALEFG